MADENAETGAEKETEQAPTEKGASGAAEGGAVGEPSSPWPRARRSEAPPAPPPPPKTDADRAAWAAPLARLDRAWTTLDARLCAGVVVAEAVSLVFWMSVDALSKSGSGGPGMIYRALLTAVVLGAGTHLATRRIKQHQVATTAAVIAGAVLGTRWGDLGSAYFANFYAWMQNASILVFFGGIGEIAKRLTFWLALLGASLATGQGKHITVDVVMRVISPKARVPVAVLGWVVAAIVSGSAAWGFFDAIAVELYHVPSSTPCPGDETKKCPITAGEKIDRVASTTGRNLFLAGRQLSLDVRSLPRVLAGQPYGKWLTAHEWNEWLRGGGWEPRFSKEDVKALELPEDSQDFRTPAVTAVPGGTDRIEQLLVPLLNMVFPFGLLIVAIRFVLRSILAAAGWVKVDPDAAHGDEELAHAHEGGAVVGGHEGAAS